MLYKLFKLKILAFISGDLKIIHDIGAIYATEVKELSEQKRNEIAAKYYRKAAMKGDAESQYDLALMLILKEIDAKEEKKEIWHLLESSADQHFEPAITLLEDIKQMGIAGFRTLSLGVGVDEIEDKENS